MPDRACACMCPYRSASHLSDFLSRPVEASGAGEGMGMGAGRVLLHRVPHGRAVHPHHPAVERRPRPAASVPHRLREHAAHPLLRVSRALMRPSRVARFIVVYSRK